MKKKSTTKHTKNDLPKEKTHEENLNDNNSEDVKLDFSGVKKFFKRIDMEAFVVTMLVLSCMILVLYIRMLPAALVVTDDWAANTIQQNIKGQVSAQVDAEFPALPQQNRDDLIAKRTTEFTTLHKAEIVQAEQQISEQYKSYMRYTAEDGQQHTYLGDLDSYFWLRYTRNVLHHGNVCDKIVNGVCIDDHILAPYGSPIGYNPSLHVFAILGLYKFITLFNGNYPLPATSFLVPVIVGMLGIIPAFFIGRRLAGNVGGVFTALIIALNPLFLSRSMGSDNDIWNVIIPLFVMWMIIEALEAKTWRWRIIFSTLTAVFIGVQAAAWEAWWFGYLIILLGLVGYLVFRIITTMVRDKDEKIWKNKQILAILAVLAIFYVGSFCAAALNGKSDGYFAIPLQPFLSKTVLDNAVNSNYWPNVLTTVAELNKSSFTDAVGSMGGQMFFFGAMLGMLLLILPKKRWNWKHYSLLVLGASLSIYLLNASLGKIETLIFITLPIALILLLYFFEEEDADIAAAMIVLVWFLATVYATYSGVRFIEYMIPAFGIGFGVFAGKIYEWTVSYLQEEMNIHKYIINVCVFLVIILLLIQPIKAGYQTAKSFVPSIDDSWWDTLKKIEAESAPNSIINSWWDFGHWFKYVADRRVTADGVTQNTHVPRWLGLSLVTSNEDEAMGTLRMLTCGSDIYPDPNGDYGAYGQLLKKTNDPIVAQQMVRDIIVLEKEPARKYLAAHGLTSEEQASILNATHCTPPEDYFITSGDMVGKAGVWAHFGLWNFTRAYVATESKKQTVQEAVTDYTKRFNMTPEGAEQIYYEARALTSEGEINAFAATWPGYLGGSWLQCAEKNTTKNISVVYCPINMQIGQQGTGVTVMESFIYNVKEPKLSVISYGVYQNKQRVGGIDNGTPSLLVLAKEKNMEDITFANPTSNTGIVYDTVNKRILLADPLLAKSMFTQLFYLDGRYSNHFVKFDDRTGFTGSRIIVWKVNWDGIDKTNGANSQTSGSSSSANIIAKAK